MSVWEDVVTTGLIGTDRRPVPESCQRAGARKRSDHRSRARGAVACCTASCCRASWWLLPPARRARSRRRTGCRWRARGARDPGRLLSPPQVDLLNLVVDAAARHGQRVAAAYWTLLAMLAPGAPPGPDGARRAVGDRGVWFVEQNPQWSGLPRPAVPPAGRFSGPECRSVEISEDAVRADPELIMAPPRHGRTNSAGRLFRSLAAASSAAWGALRTAVGAPAASALRATAVSSAADPGGTTMPPAPRRSVREALLALERTVWLRIEMRSACGEPIMVERLEIPPW